MTEKKRLLIKWAFLLTLSLPISICAVVSLSVIAVGGLPAALSFYVASSIEAITVLDRVLQVGAFFGTFLLVMIIGLSCIFLTDVMEGVLGEFDLTGQVMGTAFVQFIILLCIHYSLYGSI